MPYRIALFDADNTLLDFSRSEHDALTDCLIARGLPHDERIIARYSAINDAHWKRLEKGLTTRDQLRIDRFAVFFAEYGWDLDPTQMADDYMAALSSKAYLMDGAEALIEQLVGKCRLFIITNGIGSVQNARFDVTPLAPHFEGVFISEELGCAKPDKAFFDRVAAAIPGFDPREALVIGDSLTSDIRGGINAGIDTCWFNPRGKGAPEGMPISYTVASLSEVAGILLK